MDGSTRHFRPQLSVPGGGGAALHWRRDHPAASALFLAGAPAGQHLAGRCSGDGRLLREG
eukprot:scaffold90622_cov56-Phaeocystis_antarctica.AAC.1